MVTLPEEAAEDKKIIRNMVLNGMEIARINLSHGNLGQWEKMVRFVREIEQETGQKLKIYMDLSGPKLRTASIEIYNEKGKKKKGVPVAKGDHIILTKHHATKHHKQQDAGKVKIGVMLDEVIEDARLEDTIYFDDGMIKAVVVGKYEEEIEIVLTECYKSKLGSHKGINLPNTKLNLPALTKKDIEVLPFVCQYADIIGYSFVRSASDVEKLYSELSNYNSDQVGVVFKIENKEAFENLPEILIKGMERDKIGVMIARGDLAVEIGFERISEVQNEILWICEAAHIPVIWATQVLENLAKTGMPTRAEVSDAAKAAQAECVMLNKGPYINNAISILKNILIRMSGHSFKKKNELRALNVARAYSRRFEETAVSDQE
jgi:pyruvate kinase